MTPALAWTLATITSLSEVGYTGKAEFNFYQGGVTGVNFSQSIKPMQDIRVLPIGQAQLN